MSDINLSLSLDLHPYFVYASSEGAAHRWIKHRNPHIYAFMSSHQIINYQVFLVRIEYSFGGSFEMQHICTQKN